MNTKLCMIIIKGTIKTSEIASCIYNRKTKKWDVKFNNGKLYSYSYQNVKKLTHPKTLNPNAYHITYNEQKLLNIISILVFKYVDYGINKEYWHLSFADGKEKDYSKNDLKIVESCLNNKETKSVFEYIKQIASLSEITDKDSGENLLLRKYDKLNFIGSDVALAKYLNPTSIDDTVKSHECFPIFPFGCNRSQYTAVKNAMENQISVIQGPPGTGKTQTILNIIANILMQGKSVQVVSNNNSATENIYEKLSSKKYNLGFIVASLGNQENKKSFIDKQEEEYPDFSSWEINEERDSLKESIAEKSRQLKDIFSNQERLAILKQELSQLLIEKEYFHQYIKESNIDLDNIELKKLSSNNLIKLWNELNLFLEENKSIGIMFKIKTFFQYGILNWNIYNKDISNIITFLKDRYYIEKEIELSEEIKNIENYLNHVNKDLMDSFCDQSMMVLKDELARNFGKNDKRKVFDESSLFKEPESILKEYPVILSTTFSSRSSLNSNVVYDYIIMDEASQIDIATGALAISGAKNMVIVGDTKQLHNIVTTNEKNIADDIFKTFNISDGYKYTKSFLQSILDLMPNVKQTLLREHYRCHPKIINFCNHKFYRGELIIMTTDNGEKDVLSVIKTVKGNHARKHHSQRQIDIIKNELIPKYALNPEETGIITPYRNQVEALQSEIAGIEADTVHKFQGREKENIIISTVDDKISDFVDDPYLINVAVSRAKKKLMLIVTGNDDTKQGNITDLIDYIRYNNFEVTESKVRSIFDYLYKQYNKERRAYLGKHKKISNYDSENLMYNLIKNILCDSKYASLEVICHFPLNMLIKNLELLNERERRYVMNPNTHLDFLIYNRISKKPVMAIEVDGYQYHEKDSSQYARDLIKNHIMEIYEIPLLRFQTNGSREKETIEEMLDKIKL